MYKKNILKVDNMNKKMGEKSLSTWIYFILIILNKTVISFNLNLAQLDFEVDFHVVSYINHHEDDIHPVRVTIDNNSTIIRYFGNTSFDNIPVTFHNLRLRNVLFSLWIVHKPAVSEVENLINTENGFKEQLIFVFIMPKGEKSNLENYFKFTIYSAQIHFIFFTDIQQFHSEIYFVCNYCWQYSPQILTEEEPTSYQNDSIKSLIFKPRPTKFSNVLAAVEGRHKQLCDRIVCAAKFRVVHCARKYFNFSLALYSNHRIDLHDVGNKKHNHSIYIGGETYLAWYRSVGQNFAPYIRDTEDYYILYCENGWITTQEYSYSHWTSPLDIATWLLVVIASIGVALVGAKFKVKEFIPRILDSLAIILREPMGNMDRFDFLHVFLTLCFLCISLKYESVLTSEITIPPPPLIAYDLNELILKKGFKMFFPVFNRSLLPLYDLNEFKSGFQKYGIDVFLPNIQGSDYEGASKESCLANRSNKVATDVPQSEKEIQILEYGIASFKNNRFCHIVIKPFFKRHYSYHVKGYKFARIVSFLHLLREVGLETMWNKNYKWFLHLRKLRKFMTKKYSNRVFATYSKDYWAPHGAMRLSGKFLQIFVICGIILGFAMLWGLGELCYTAMIAANDRVQTF